MSDSIPSATPPLLLTLTAQIVAAHVGGNPVAAESLPALIQSVYATLAGTGAEPVAVERQEPAVPVKRSIHQDYLVCLEDGAKMKMLKRYIAKRYNLTPAQYKSKWGLPADYPMVAPAYAERRSVLAKQIGLGRKQEGAAVVEEEAPASPAKAPRRRRAAAASGSTDEA